SFGLGLGRHRQPVDLRVGLPLCGIRIAAILASRAAPTGAKRTGRPAGVAEATPRSLRLEAQDVALSRLKHGFESRRERHTSGASRTRKPAQRCAGFFLPRARRTALAGRLEPLP